MSFFSNLFGNKSDAQAQAQLDRIEAKVDSIEEKVNQIPTLVQKVEEIRTIVFEDRSQIVRDTPAEAVQGMTYGEVFSEAGITSDQVVVTKTDGSFSTCDSGECIAPDVSLVQTVVEAQSLG